VVALTTAYRLSSIGVEFDSEIADKARVNIDDLKSSSILNNTPSVIATGDFTLDETYRNAGVKFEEIGTFFNFMNNAGGITAKIVNQSLVGTKFLLYCTYPMPNKFQGLVLEETLGIIDVSIDDSKLDRFGPVRVNPGDSNRYAVYMHIYKKC